MTLPFPFDAVESFFNDFFSKIYAALIDLPGRIISALAGLGAIIQNTVNPIIASLQSAIFSQLNYIKDQILGVFAGVPQAVNTLTGGIIGALQPFFSNIYNNIVQFTSTIYNRIVSFVGPALATLQQGFNGILNNIGSSLSASFAVLARSITPALQQVGATLGSIPGFLQQKATEIQQGTIALGNNINQNLAGITTYISNNFGAFTRAMNDFGGQIKGATIALTDIVPSLDKLGSQIWQSGSKIFKDAYDATLKPIFDSIYNLAADVGKRLQDFIRPQGPLTPETAVAISGTLGAAATTVLATRWGINTLGKILTIGQVSALQHDFTELLASLGVIAAGEKFNTAPIEYGLLPIIARGWRKILRPEIPGISEVIEAADRRYFEGDGKIAAPEAIKDLLSQHGLGDTFQDLVWTNHFIPLGYGQLSDAWHRGKINDAEFSKRLDFLAYYGTDKDLLKELSYNYPAARQARVLAQIGALTEDQINKVIAASGIHPDFQASYKLLLQEGNILPLLTRIETTALDGYKNDVLNDDDFTNLLKQARKPDTVIANELSLARLERDLDFKKYQIATIEQALARGTLSLDDGKTELTKIGLGPDRIAIIITRAQYKQQILGKKKGAAATKNLTVAQIVKAVKQGDIKLEDGFNQVQAQGYDAQETKVLFEIGLGVTI